MLEWRTLLSEDKKCLSLGRVAFWIALLYSTWFWFHPISTFPPALLEFLYATLAYNLGRAGVNAYQNVRIPSFTQQSVQTKPIINTDQDITEEDLQMTKGKK